MVWTPEPAMLKPIVSGPEFALASRIAWRSDPAPLSAVVVTVYVLPKTADAGRATRKQVRRRLFMGHLSFRTRGTQSLSRRRNLFPDLFRCQPGRRSPGDRDRGG